jgi:hypothetical protein
MCAPLDPRTFMGGDASRLFRADESSQSGSSFPESGTSLRSAVLCHVTHDTRAAMGKEDGGSILHCEHSLSSHRSPLLVLCVRTRPHVLGSQADLETECWSGISSRRFAGGFEGCF